MERILVVEDSVLQGKIIVDLLTDHNFIAELADTGEGALQKLRDSNYDLMLMDMVLPDVSGIQLIKKIKLLPNTVDLPIIVVSGLTDKENVIESLGMGIHDYITKPYHAKELINRINIHLGIRRARIHLMHANAANDKFLSVLGHDLKSSFATLHSAIDLLDRFIEDKQQRTIVLEEAKRSTRQVNKLLDELLLWGKMVNHGIVQQNERFDLNHHVLTALSKLTDEIKNKGIELHNAMNGEAMVLADKNMMEAVLRNIISNAKKFTPRGGSITISSHTILRGAEKYHQITIADSGVGMTPQTLERLFSKAYQTIEKDTEGNSGIGLGLSIAKEFTEKNAGELQTESKRGEGSKFFLLLPAIE